MADYYRREVTTRRVEFVVPMKHESGINWTEIMKAIQAAHSELYDALQIPRGQEAADDQITLVPGDEDIVVRYVTDCAVGEAVNTDV